MKVSKIIKKYRGQGDMVDVKIIVCGMVSRSHDDRKIQKRPLQSPWS